MHTISSPGMAISWCSANNFTSSMIIDFQSLVGTNGSTTETCNTHGPLPFNEKGRFRFNVFTFDYFIHHARQASWWRPLLVASQQRPHATDEKHYHRGRKELYTTWLASQYILLTITKNNLLLKNEVHPTTTCNKIKNAWSSDCFRSEATQQLTSSLDLKQMFDINEIAALWGVEIS